MVLVDPKMLQGGMVPQQLIDPTALRNPEVGVIDMTIKGLDDGLRSILDTPNIPGDQKVKLYSNYLQDYLVLQKKKSGIYSRPTPVTYAQPPPKEVDVDSSIEADVMLTVPKTLKRQAGVLVERIKRDPAMGWTERGELVLHGKKVDGTNVVDLVKDILSKRKGVEPRGWRLFASHLADSNIPRDLVRNPDRLHFMEERENEVSDSEELSPESVLEGIMKLEEKDEKKILKKFKKKAGKKTKRNTWVSLP